MKVGDLVHNADFDISESPDLGIILEVDLKARDGTAKYLVQFDDSANWCAGHHLEMISESR